MQQSVLIVESDPAELDKLCSYASEVDVRIQTAVDLPSAMRRISENRFSIIMLDWQLPDSQSAQLVENIRSQHRLRRMHIIALSEPADPETIQCVLNSGVNDFFSRPISSGEVKNRLNWAKSRVSDLV